MKYTKLTRNLAKSAALSSAMKTGNINLVKAIAKTSKKSKK